MALLRGGCLWNLGVAMNCAELEPFSLRGDRSLVSCPCAVFRRQECRGVRVVVGCSTGWNSDARRLDDARRLSCGVLVSTRAGVLVASASRPQRGTSPRGQSERDGNGFKPQRQPGEPSKMSKIEDDADEDFGEDELEAFFAQLEEDLEAGGISDSDDVTEEEFVELENELTAALLEIEEQEEELMSAMSFRSLESTSDVRDSSLSEKMSSEQSSGEEANWHDDEILEDDKELAEDNNRIVKLESWQLQKLAAAAELGRRKVNIKALSAEVGLDRFDVLAWLKNPPPELLMYSTTMESTEQPGEPASTGSSQASSIASKQSEDAEAAADGKRNWQQQKRLRKDDEATLELVFRKTSRPSNAMIQNLVELTHLPKKRVLEWFEDQRQRLKSKPKFEALR